MLLTLHMNEANCNKKRAQMFELYIENNVCIILQLYHLTLLTHTAFKG